MLMFIEMKRLFFTFFLVFFGAAALFGADFSLSLGGGAYIGGLFTRYTLKADGQIDGNPVSINAAQTMNQLNYGAYVFIDGTWAVFSLGIQRGRNTYIEPITAESDRGQEIDKTNEGTGSELMLTLVLIGKYPFKLGEKLTLFPQLGIEYQIALAQFRRPEGRVRYNRTDGIREADVDGNPYKLSVWNSLFVDIGAGMDIDISSSLFLRAELLYAFRLQTPYETDALEQTKRGINAPKPKYSGLTAGPAFKVAAGWHLL